MARLDGVRAEISNLGDDRGQLGASPGKDRHGLSVEFPLDRRRFPEEKDLI